MIKEANKKYANVSKEALELFKELCDECQLKKRKLASKGLVVKPIVSKEFNSRGQVHSSHSSLKSSSASLETLAYFLLASLIILSRHPCPVAM
jgi:hypothetical protein